jgi:hypothetical protein
MDTNTKKPTTPKKRTPKLTDSEIARAATNSPALSPDKITVGEYEIALVDLPFDEYMEFVTLFAPALDALVGRVAKSANVPSIPGIVLAGEEVSVAGIFTYCKASLPQLAHIVVRQSQPSLTVEDVKRLFPTPFKMADLVFAQVKRNNIIGEMADFFKQVAPMMKKG